jgi:hypothetical protein
MLESAAAAVKQWHVQRLATMRLVPFGMMFA